MSSRAPGPRRQGLVTVDLDWRSVMWAMGAFVALVAVTGVVRSAPRTMAWLLIGSLLALALDPIVAAVDERLGWGRRLAVGAVLAGFVLAAALIVALLVPPAIREVRGLPDEIPEVAESLGNLPLIGDELREREVPDRLREWVDELPERLAGDASPLEGLAERLLGGLQAASVTLIFTITLLLDGSRLVTAARRLVPRRYHERADRAGGLAYDIVGRYFAGSLLVAGLAGLSTLIAGLVLGVPLAPLAAVWVSLTNLIPQIGGAAGGIPFVVLAVTQGAGIGLLAGVFFVLYLQFENHILQPIVVGKTIKLSPPATMAAALVGASAAGVVGALVAVPLTGVSKALYQELRPARTAPAGDNE